MIAPVTPFRPSLPTQEPPQILCHLDQVRVIPVQRRHARLKRRYPLFLLPRRHPQVRPRREHRQDSPPRAPAEGGNGVKARTPSISIVSFVVSAHPVGSDLETAAYVVAEICGPFADIENGLVRNRAKKIDRLLMFR
jgi:hypothetical protein